ncbi:MAG: glutathione S-transferase N-terminal domain-containing protein, partial [Rhodospirillaceae bacterium]
MIELYTWMTDNGYKARQAMEESGLAFELKPVNLREKEQFAPEFLRISPGHKIPALVDTEGPGG